MDLASPRWKTDLFEKARVEPIEEGTYFCVGHASTIAQKMMPESCILRIKTPGDIPEDAPKETEESGIAAVKVGDILVSPRAHPALKNSKVWMSPYHVELIKELLSNGFTVEVLDEYNNVIQEVAEE